MSSPAADADDSDGTTRGPPPWWCWVVLCSAVFAVSSAGVFFTVMGDVPPITLAGWRLQLTAVITLIAGSVQWTTVMSPADRSRWRTDAPLTALSGLALGVHFGLWVWSLQHTSLAHSLLLVSTSPVLNVGVALLLRHAISWGEVAGSLLALAGCGVLAAEAAAGAEAAVTLAGDLAAFGAAVAVVVHWQLGQKLRTYQPVFVYAAVVTTIAACLLTLVGFLAESHSLLGGPQRHGCFGWLISRHYAPYVIYLGVVPGIVGHQGFNTVLKYISPLLVSLAVQFEPLLGPLLGWLCGVAEPPGRFTIAGGAIVLAATLGATLATAQRQAREEAAENESATRRLAKAKSGPLQQQQDGNGTGAAGDEERGLLLASERDQLLPAGEQTAPAAFHQRTHHHHHHVHQGEIELLSSERATRT